jgi:hypothetical protein
VDEPGVYGAGAEQPVSSGAGQPPAEFLDGDQEVTGFGDGVDAQVRSRSVGRAAQDARRIACVAAVIMAAMPLFMSEAPLPKIFPSSMRGSSGSPS